MASLLVVGLMATSCGGDGEGASVGETETSGPDAETPAAGDTAATDDESPAELREVRLGISTTNLGPAQGAYSSLPGILGYWEEEGLDVEVLGFPGSGETVAAMEAGEIPVAMSAPGLIFSAVGAGADFITYFNHVSKNYFLPAVPEDSPITEVEDFVGTTIGVASLQSTGVPIMRALLASENLDPESVEYVATGLGVEALNALEADRVDGLSMWDAPYAEIENLGVPLRTVANEEMRNLGFHQVLFAPQSVFDEDPELLVKIARGIAKATVFAYENPEAAVRLHWEVYPETKPTGVSDEEALAQGLSVLEARLSYTEPAVEGVWGSATEDQVRQHAEFLVSAGQLEEPVPPEEIWTDELLDEINDFDEEAIRESARNWTE